MTIYFKYGCFFAVERQQDGREMAGLACCKTHERPHAQLEQLGSLEIERVTLLDSWQEAKSEFDTMKPSI